MKASYLNQQTQLATWLAQKNQSGPFWGQKFSFVVTQGFKDRLLIRLSSPRIWWKCVPNQTQISPYDPHTPKTIKALQFYGLSRTFQFQTNCPLTAYQCSKDAAAPAKSFQRQFPEFLAFLQRVFDKLIFIRSKSWFAMLFLHL